MFGVVGPREPLTWSQALGALVEAGRAGTELVWVDETFLRAHVKEEDGELPLWDIDYPGLHSFDASKAIAAGLHHRPLSETIADTLAWDRGRGALKVGLTPERERALLQMWSVSGGLPPPRPLARAHHPLQHVDAPRERRQPVGGEGPQARRQRLHPLRPAFPQRTGPLGGGAHDHRAGVRRIGPANDVSIPFHAVDQTRHGRRFDLLGLGELAHPPRPGEDQHGQRRESGCGDPERFVLHAQASQQVDRGRVQAIGHRIHISRRGSRP